MAIHDIFPPSPTEVAEDPVLFKKLHQGEGAWAIRKDILGWTFDGEHKTMELEDKKYDKIMAAIKKALRSKHGVPFKDFEKLKGKLVHASQGIPAGRGLFQPFNQVIQQHPKTVWLRKGSLLRNALVAWRELLRENQKEPTHVKELVEGPPDTIGIVDSSKEGVGGVVVGGILAC